MQCILGVGNVLRGECWGFCITWAKDPICPQIKKEPGRSGLAGTSALHVPGSVLV